MKKPKILGTRVDFKPHKQPRKSFRQYTLSFLDDDKKAVFKKFKFLKEAKKEAMITYRENTFISLRNHKGIALCL